MSVAAKKIIGIVMVVIAIFGFLLSSFLLYQVWHFRQPVINGLEIRVGPCLSITPNHRRGTGGDRSSRIECVYQHGIPE